MDVKTVNIRGDKTKYNHEVSVGSKIQLKILINYLTDFPLRGRKRLVFDLWKKVALLFSSGEHLSLVNNNNRRIELENTINQVKLQNQSFKIEKSVLKLTEET